MIRAVLIDLDGTLIKTDTQVFFSTYLKALGDYSRHITQPEKLIDSVMQAYTTALGNSDPLLTLYEKFMPAMAALVHHDEANLRDVFASFYANCYSNLRDMVEPQPASRPLIEWLHAQRYEIAVATNPGLPETAIRQRMAWGGISADSEPFDLVTTMETMHFGKPSPAYYEEIMARLALSPGEAIMVGDSWENDIVGATKAGLHTFWVTSEGDTPPDSITPSGQGSFESFVDKTLNGWLSGLVARPPMRESLIDRLKAFPASLDAIRRERRPAILECAPADGEWSARDIVCHLRDHEVDEDRARLQRIIDEDNPFLSVNYDPWAHASSYGSTTTKQALVGFAADRMATVEWLQQLPADAWSRAARSAIFGPTNFEEMVRFTTEHDLTHLRQLHSAIEQATSACGN